MILGPNGERLPGDSSNRESGVQVGFDYEKGMIILKFPEPAEMLGLPVATALILAHQIQAKALEELLPDGLPR